MAHKVAWYLKVGISLAVAVLSLGATLPLEQSATPYSAVPSLVGGQSGEFAVTQPNSQDFVSASLTAALSEDDLFAETQIALEQPTSDITTRAEQFTLTPYGATPPQCTQSDYTVVADGYKVTWNCTEYSSGDYVRVQFPNDYYAQSSLVRGFFVTQSPSRSVGGGWWWISPDSGYTLTTALTGPSSPSDLCSWLIAEWNITPSSGCLAFNAWSWPRTLDFHDSGSPTTSITIFVNEPGYTDPPQPLEQSLPFYVDLQHPTPPPLSDNPSLCDDYTVDSPQTIGPGVVCYKNLTVNSTLTVLNDTSVDPPIITTIIAENVTVNSTGSISATGQGYLGGFANNDPANCNASDPVKGACAGFGPGGGGSGYLVDTFGYLHPSAGSHGGLGSFTAAPYSPAYGDFRAPIEPGSGGGASNTDGYSVTGWRPAGSGGGAIRIVVVNTLSVLNPTGSIVADGGTASGLSGTGAGGSIWIQAGQLSGIGTIQAVGGIHNWNQGGGGRIAIDTPNRVGFSGGVRAHGGTYSSRAGGAGTVYWIVQDELHVNNWDRYSSTPTFTPIPDGEYSFSKMFFSGAAQVHFLGENSTLTVTNSNFNLEYPWNRAKVTIWGTLVAPENFTLNIVDFDIQGDFIGPTGPTGNLTLGANLTLHNHTPLQPLGIFEFGTLEILSGSTLYVSSRDFSMGEIYRPNLAVNPYNYVGDRYVTVGIVYDRPISLNVATLVIRNQGAINASSLGHYGPECVWNWGSGSWSVHHIGGGAGMAPIGTRFGASHGGRGSAFTELTTVQPYGDMLNPISLGSASNGGEGWYHCSRGGQGGGAIRLNLTGNLTLEGNGLISANGEAVHAGGSGGSIYVQAESILGTGTIQANGANGGNGEWYNPGAPGGGGRIAIDAQSIAPTVNIQANGGTGSTVPAENGTVFYHNGLPPSQSFATNECPFCNNSSRVYSAGQGVNVQSGNFNYQHRDDQPIPSLAGELLSFTRSYNSLTSGVNADFMTYNRALGPGWTHNYDVRLVFSGDPGGEPNTVILIAPRGSQMRFYDSGQGTYTPFPGVLASMAYNAGASQYTVTTNTQYQYVFAANGVLLSVTDPPGDTVTLTYNGSNQLWQIRDAAGRGFDLAYYGDGKLQTVTQVGLGTPYAATYAYNGNGELSQVTDMYGVTYGYAYSGPLTEVRLDPAGVNTVVVSNVYDGVGRVLEQRNGNGDLLVDVDYPSENQRTITTPQAGAPTGTVVTTTVDFEGNLPINTVDPLGNTSATDFNDAINPEALVDGNNNTTGLTWDGNNITAVTDAAGVLAAQMEYDAYNNVTRMEDALGRVTVYEYNDPNDPTLATRMIENYVDGVYDPLNPEEDQVTDYVYNADGLLQLRTESDGQQTYYAYTVNGQVETVTRNYQDPDISKRLTTTYTYDGQGRVDTVTDAQGRVTKNVYNLDGTLASVIRNYLDGQPQNFEDTYNLTTTYFYDSARRQVRVVDTLGHASWTCYDSLGRVVRRVSNATGDGLTPATDPCDAVNYVPSTAVDEDLITQTVYDVLGYPIATIQPDGRVDRTYYDELGRVVVTIQNLTVDINTALGAVPAWSPATPDENFRTSNTAVADEYDGAGNLVSTTDLNGTETYYCFDELNRVVKTIVNPSVQDPCAPYAPSSASDTDIITETVYDIAGNAIATIDPLGVITRTYYDDHNRPAVVIRNLTGQGIEVATPPTYNPANPDENIGTQTVYDEAGRAYQTIELTTNRTNWTCYDGLGRVVRTVQNATGADPCAPGYTGSSNPDEDIISETVYDTDGRQIATIAPDGLITRTYYDAVGRRYAVVTNLTGQGIEAETPPTWVDTDEDANLRTVWTYDALGRVVTVTSLFDTPRAQTDWTCYDELGRVVRTVQNATGDGLTPATNPCDGANYVPGTATDEDVIMQTVYERGGNAIATIAPDGTVTRTYYDGLDRPVVVVSNLTVAIDTPLANVPAWSSADPDANLRQTRVYDEIGRAYRTIDNAGMIVETRYDAVGRAFETVVNYVDGTFGTETPDEDITTTTFFNKRGEVIAQRDTYGVLTMFDYDNLGRLVAVIENYDAGKPADHETNVRTEYGYDGRGNRLTITNARNYTTTFVYDALDRMLSESDPLSHATTYTYDKLGRRVTMTDANGTVTTYSYDVLRRLEEIDYSDTTDSVTFGYDVEGNRVSMADGLGTTNWAYDELNRPVQITDPFSNVVGYGYDIFGRRTQLTYPNTNTVDYAFDLLGRLAGVTDWDAQTTPYGYTAAGQMESVVLPNGVTTAYSYDDAHRLTGITHATQTATLSGFSYELDGVGNRVAVDEIAEGELTFSDGFEGGNFSGWTSATVGNSTSNQLVVAGTPALDGSFDLTVVNRSGKTNSVYVQRDYATTQATYTAEMLLDLSDVNMAGGAKHYIMYAGANTGTPDVIRVELTKVNNGDPNAFQVRVGTRNDATGYVTTSNINLTRGVVYRLRVEWAAATAVGANNGFVRLIATNVGTGTVVTQQKLNIDNDTRRIQRLRVGGVAGMDSATTGSYSLDAVTTSAGVGQTTTTISYTYDALYRLTSATYSTGARYTYAYDAVGNRTNETLCTAWDGATCTGDETSTTYTYDEANRLMTSQPTLNGLPGPMTTYTWDDAGRLLSDGTTTYTWDAAHRLTRLDDGTTVHTYAYDGLGNRYVADGETYVLDIAAGLTQVLADPTITYLYGAGRIGGDDSAWTYYHGDALGSVRALSDASGQAISAHGYSPYGDPTSAAPDEFGYTGEQVGAGGLVYLRARYYDPGVGVFLSHDPWSGDVMRPASMNGWSYVEGNPVMYTDPSGACIDGKSGAIRWNESPFGTSGLCTRRHGGAKVGASDDFSRHLQSSPSETLLEMESILGSLGSGTPAQDVLNSTVRLRISDDSRFITTATPCPSSTPQPTATLSSVFNSNDSTATYLGNGEFYTHNHFTADIHAPNTKAVIFDVLDADGNSIPFWVPLDLNQSTTTSFGDGHTIISATQPLAVDLYLQTAVRPVVSATLRSQSGLAAYPGASSPSIVTVPHWNGSQYEAIDLIYVGERTDLGEAAGDFMRPAEQHLFVQGDSGGGIWHAGVVIGNTWERRFYQVSGSPPAAGVTGALWNGP